MHKTTSLAQAILGYDAQAAEPDGPMVWPLPSRFTMGKTTMSLMPKDGFFSVSGGTSKLLNAAFKRYDSLAFPHAVDGASSKLPHAKLTGLQLEVDDLDESHPQLDTDESYSLTVPDQGGAAKATAKTVYGALRALETFSQLVRYDFDSGTYAVAGAPWRIDDAPRFPHRGLMVDTGRHYQPLASIRAIIDSLVYAKLNVLHWHMVDTESFPFEVRSHPKLWDAAHGTSQRYTQADVAGIVEYARLRGVRVMVEFDVPGHAQSWCKGYPEICLPSECATAGALTPPLNVASNATWSLITNLLSEVTGDVKSKRGKPSGLFPDDFVHLGGDEVETSCWDNDPNTQSFKLSNGITSGDDTYGFFVAKAGDIAAAKGRRPVQWAEAWQSGRGRMQKDSIVHVWQKSTNVAEVLADGHNVLLNVGYDPMGEGRTSDSWYLDNLNVPWRSVYGNEPCAEVTDEACKGILGGHGEMWGETVDGSNLQHTVWPRLSAIAEKLWSKRDATAVDETGAIPESTTARFKEFRCLLLERGVAAAPAESYMARSAPEEPGSCLDQ
jgi:hexosaminidase